MDAPRGRRAWVVVLGRELPHRRVVCRGKLAVGRGFVPVQGAFEGSNLPRAA